MKCKICHKNMSLEVFLNGIFWYCWSDGHYKKGGKHKIKAETYRRKLIDWSVPCGK